MSNRSMETFYEERGGPTSRTRIKIDLQRLPLAAKAHGAVILEIVDTVGFILQIIYDGGIRIPERSCGCYSNHRRGLACG